MNISTNLCWASVKIYRWKQRLQAKGAVVCWKASADGGSAEWSSAGVREFRSVGAGVQGCRAAPVDFTQGWDGRRYYECNL